MYFSNSNYAVLMLQQQKYVNSKYQNLRLVVTEAGICLSTMKLIKYFKARQNEYEKIIN